MSEQADRQRNARQHFAAPGGRHDRLVRVLRVALPSVIGVLLAFLVFSPFSQTQERSFVLDKDDVNLAGERLRLTEALYRGQDSKGRPFSLRAGSAVQKSSTEPLLRLRDLSGRLLMADGPAELTAGQGYYDMKTEKVRVEGPLAFTGGNGFSLTASNVEFAMKTRQVESFGPVSGSMRVGSFSAGKLRADLDARIVRLEGGARLRIDQNAIR
jgi:lipopolysaccharide export system protein LptC